MDDNQVESTVKSNEDRSNEKKDYHAPELAEYGDLRAMTQTSTVTLTTFDGTIEVTAS